MIRTGKLKVEVKRTKRKTYCTHQVLRELWFPVFEELVKHLHLVLDPEQTRTMGLYRRYCTISNK